MSTGAGTYAVSRRNVARSIGVTPRQLDHAAVRGVLPEQLTSADLEWLIPAARLASLGVAFYAAVLAIRAGWRPPVD